MTQVATAYGGALYDLAREEGLEETILKQLEMTKTLWQENPEYVRLLREPSVPKQERCRLLDESFSGQVHVYLLNWLKILCEKGYIAQVGGCLQAFRQMYNRDHNILEVRAVTAVPLREALREKLVARLMATTGKSVDLTCSVDPSCLGGIRLEMEGKLLDGTVRRRLDELQSSLRRLVL